MPQEITQSTSTTIPKVNTPPKTGKQKTLAPGNAKSMAQIDVTKPMSQQDQSLIRAKNKNEESKIEEPVSPNGKKSIPELNNSHKKEKDNPPKNNKKYATQLVTKFQDNIEKLKIELSSIIISRPKVVILVLEKINKLGAGLISRDFLADESKCKNDYLKSKMIQYILNPEFTSYINLQYGFSKLEARKKVSWLDVAYRTEAQQLYDVGDATKDQKVAKEHFNYGTNLSGPVGKNQANASENVKIVALALQEYGISGVPEACLNGEWDSKLIDCIKTFQTSPNAGYYERKVYKSGQKGQKGVIKQGDPTFNALFKNFGVKPIYQGVDTVNENIEGDNISLMSYNNNTLVETLSEERDDYYEKLDKLSEGLGLRGKYSHIVQMASKAANDEKYFNKYTKNVIEKLTYNESTISDGEVTLSPLLLFRMRKLHKFLVAAGLYKGNMPITGLRSKQKAHRWSTQYSITQNIQSNTVKNNLIDLYNDPNRNNGTNVSDKYGNIWAKTSYFTQNADNSVTLDWESVQADANNLTSGQGFRNDPSSPANEGYVNYADKKPNYNRAVSNHCAGKAIDISSDGLILKTEAMIDLIGLQFGVIRCGGVKEAWHYQLTGVKMTDAEIEEMQND